MSEQQITPWSVVPATDRIPCDSWQMFRKYDGIEEFFGGFWPNKEDAEEEAKALHALEARASAAGQLSAALERLMEFQNGAPLVTWEAGWNDAMSAARNALEAARAAGVEIDGKAGA